MFDQTIGTGQIIDYDSLIDRLLLDIDQMVDVVCLSEIVLSCGSKEKKMFLSAS